MEECYFTESNTPAWVFFIFLKNCTNEPDRATHLEDFS